MKAIEPFRIGREYEVRLDWLLNNIEPWDQPECWYCEWRAVPEEEPGNQHERFGDFCIEVPDFRALPTWEQWDRVLQGKRLDEQYPDIVRSLSVLGFVRNPTFQVTEDGRVEKMGDGHHRIAAALELGFPTVPFRAAPSTQDTWANRSLVVSDDSGSSGSYGWDLTDEQMEALSV